MKLASAKEEFQSHVHFSQSIVQVPDSKCFFSLKKKCICVHSPQQIRRKKGSSKEKEKRQGRTPTKAAVLKMMPKKSNLISIIWKPIRKVNFLAHPTSKSEIL